MKSRSSTRFSIAAKAVARRGFARRKPADPREILVVATYLVGDALLQAALLAKLRERYPSASIRMTMAPAVVPLFAGLPYRVEARGFNPRDAGTLAALSECPAPDLAIVPGDNRNSWLAAALGARWIVAFAGDRPAYKSWPVDEEIPMPSRPVAWSDMSTGLAEGPAPARYRPADWPAPPAAAFDRPHGRYAVLHVEASTPLKHWESAKWLSLANALSKMSITPVWSSGRDGEGLIRRIDPGKTYQALGHALDLPQLWHLVADATLLVCPDTSVAHIGKLTFTPTVCLFGPSSAELFGKGEFWRDAPFAAVTMADFPCRDQHTLFKRRIEWIRRCQRSTDECAEPRCMHAIGVEAVLAAVKELTGA